METESIRRPAISGIESAVFGVMGLAGLFGIILAVASASDLPEGTSAGAAMSSSLKAAAPVSPAVAASAAHGTITPYPRAI